jgi:hypothetical protein
MLKLVKIHNNTESSKCSADCANNAVNARCKKVDEHPQQNGNKSFGR